MSWHKCFFAYKPAVGHHRVRAAVQVHFMRLAGAQVLHLQAQVDRELSMLALHRLERTREGAAGRVSRLYTKRTNKGRKAVHSLLLNWEYWYKLRQPGSTVPVYTHDEVLLGSPPWRPSGLGTGPAAVDALKMRMHRVSAELARSSEELRFIPGEAANSLNLARYQISQVSKAITVHMQDGAKLATGKVFLLRSILSRLLKHQSDALKIYAEKKMNFRS